MRTFFIGMLLLASLSARSIDAYFNHAVFYSPEDGPYVETQMLFNASSIRYQETANGFQARIELTYIFEHDGKVIDFSKNVVKSPYTPDSLHAIVDFLDVQRFDLAPRDYQLKIQLRDLNNPKDSASFNQSISVAPPKEGAFFSSVVFIDTVYDNHGTTSKFSRGNVDMIPRISGYQGPDRKTLSVYTELYHTEYALGGTDDYLVTLDIIDKRGDRLLGSYHINQRKKGNEVEPVFQSWDIRGLGTGNYLLQIEARNRQNQVIAQTTAPIQRHNFVPDSEDINATQLQETFVGEVRGEDSLRTMLYCMRYQASTFEAKYIDEHWKEGDTTELRRFFYSFWRDRNPIDPETAWKQYHQKIEYVEREFGLGNKRKHSCRTDRGRVYLVYGKPDTRVIQNREPNASPYEIWHYYKTPSKSNAKFVFYDRTLITNDYVLLHSNVPGEAVDYAWYQRLSTPAVNPSGNDEPFTNQGNVSDPRNLNGMELDEVGSRALEYWNNPR